MGSPRNADELPFEGFCGTPGKKWEDYDKRLKDYASGKTDDRGYSLADMFMGLDEGGAAAGAPAMPVTWSEQTA